MEVFENKGDCRFHGSLATDRAGRLYDSRFRDAIRSNRRPLSERGVRTVEAMTALRITARLTRQLLDRRADNHGLSEGRLHALFQPAAAPNHRPPLRDLADDLHVSPRTVPGPIDQPRQDAP